MMLVSDVLDNSMSIKKVITVPRGKNTSPVNITMNRSKTDILKRYLEYRDSIQDVNESLFKEQGSSKAISRNKFYKMIRC